MTYPVRITKAAKRDLSENYTWIAEHDSVAHAEYVLDCLTQSVESIATLPERGSRPRELRAGMRRDCRRVSFKPYRVFYEVRPTEVVVFLIADGGRNLKALLLRGSK
jgi:toxin ParE1/3/4